MSLDIDADAEMLKEQLNISDKAIDYFRASSKLLQEGVKAGLSLYDIAVMCCRNDNAGEIPSKLERLTAMASELAILAVENGRWNHAAASKALASQLSPDGGSLLQHRKESSANVFKSVSSINLVSLRAEADAGGTMPAMTQSTGSDTDSDSVDDDDHTDCNEWAASMIADISLDQHQSMSMLQSMRGKPRSSSVTSEQSSDSPKGFWYTRPGSPTSETAGDESDADSFTWSPNLSSMNLADLDKEAIPPVAGEVTIFTPTVAFAESFSGPFLLPPPATVNVSSFGSSKNQGVFGPFVKKSSLIRSKSELALSSRSSSIISADSSGIVQDGDQFREYKNKFVELVIVRETTSQAKAC